MTPRSNRTTALVQTFAALILAADVPLMTTNASGDDLGGPGGIAGGPNAGPDLIGGDLPGMQQFGRVGSLVGLGMSSTVCNKGNSGVNWQSLPAVTHPVQVHNLYQLKNDRFQQIGQSWAFHQFNALETNLCGFVCSSDCCVAPGCSAGSILCGGCSSSVAVGPSASANALGSRAWIQPYTGVLPSNSNDHAGHSHDGVSHRLQADDADLAQDINQNNTAQYFAEAQFVSQHEYLPNNGVANNQFNNASYRRFTVSGTSGGTYTFTPSGGTVQEQSALNAWTGATIVPIEPDPGADGRAFLAYKVTPLGGGQWHYEYAVYNMNFDRSFRMFEVPAAGVAITNPGFHAPKNHPGFPNDGTGGVGYSNTPWTHGPNGTWTTETFAANPNANAIRWGTLYNFRFDANAAPVSGSVTLGIFQAGSPSAITVPALVPAHCQGDITGNNAVDVDDLFAVINSWGPCANPNNCPADVAPAGGNDTVDVDDLFMVINGWGPCG